METDFESEESSTNAKSLWKTLFSARKFLVRVRSSRVTRSQLVAKEVVHYLLHKTNPELKKEQATKNAMSTLSAKLEKIRGNKNPMSPGSRAKSLDHSHMEVLRGLQRRRSDRVHVIGNRNKGKGKFVDFLKLPAPPTGERRQPSVLLQKLTSTSFSSNRNSSSSNDRPNTAPTEAIMGSNTNNGGGGLPSVVAS